MEESIIRVNATGPTLNDAMLQLHNKINVYTIDVNVRAKNVSRLTAAASFFLYRLTSMRSVYLHQIGEKSELISRARNILLMDDETLTADDIDNAIIAIRAINTDAKIVIFSLR